MRVIPTQDRFCSGVTSPLYFGTIEDALSRSFPQGGGARRPLGDSGDMELSGELLLSSFPVCSPQLSCSTLSYHSQGILSPGPDARARAAGSKFFICSSPTRSPAVNLVRGVPHALL